MDRMNKQKANRIVAIAEKNIQKALKDVAGKYAKGDLVDVGCGLKPYKYIFARYVDSHFGIEEPVQTEMHYKKKRRG